MTERPPRRKIPDRVKAEVLLRALGLRGVAINWSHEPALELRAINDAGTDYVPAQLDPAYIFCRPKEDHDKLTFKDNGTGRSDLGAIAHVRRSAKKHAAHLARMDAKADGEPVRERPRRGITSRPFDKTKTRKVSGGVVPRKQRRQR